MKGCSGILSLLGLVLVLLVAEAEGATRIGIVTKDPTLASLADLMTVKFSQDTNVVILERAQVQKVWQEQALKAGQQSNYRNLSEVLGAEGIVLMDVVKERAGLFLVTRLLAVKSGVVVDFSRHKLPLPDQAGWSDLFVRRQIGLLPKLSINREQAVPLSFLNVRASLALPGTAVTEQQLNVLINHRLMSQREFFLLERRQLGTLAAEKELQQVEDSAFWTGSHILEGLIDKDGIVPGKISLSMTLQPPNNRPKVPFEVSGDKNDLPALVEQVLWKLLPLMNSDSGTGAWNAVEESKQYADEAAWAFKWQLHQEARIAADAAWILGQKTMSVAKIRVSTRQIASQTKLQFQYVNDRQWVTNAPPADKLPSAITLLLTYEECTRQLGTGKNKTPNDWTELGLAALQTAAELLEHYRLMPREQLGVDQPLADLKAECRRHNDLLEQMVSANDRSLRARVDLLRLRYCSCWAATPDDAMQAYRQQFKAGTFATNRLAVLQESEYKLHYWRFEDRPKTRALWAAFLDELKNSTNAWQRCDGLLLDLRDLPKSTDPEHWNETDKMVFRKGAEAVLAMVWDDTKGFSAAVFPEQLTAMEQLILRRAEKLPDAWAKEMMVKQKARAYEKFKHYLKHLPDISMEKTYYGPLGFEWTQERFREAIPLLHGKQELSISAGTLAGSVSYSLTEKVDYLRTVRVFDGSTFNVIFDNNRNYTREEADVLRPVLEEYKLRLPAAQRAVDILFTKIDRKIPSLALKQQQARQQEAKITTRTAELASLLKNAKEYDRRTAQALSQEYFTPEDARKLLSLWKAHLQQTGTERPLAAVAAHLQARSYPLEEVQNYFRKAPAADEQMLAMHITNRKPTRAEAEQLKPVFLEYAKRIGLAEQVTNNYRRQLDAAIEAELPR